MSAPIVVIYGPQGSGKSLHASGLRKHYGCKRVVDDEGRSYAVLRSGDLVISQDTLQELRREQDRGLLPRTALLVPIEEALAAMSGAGDGKAPGSRLNALQRGALQWLAARQQPARRRDWRPDDISVSTMHALARNGLAAWAPAGLVITDAGRAAIATPGAAS